MDQELVKNEIHAFLERMGFGDHLETVEAKQGYMSYFNVRLRHAVERTDPESGERTGGVEMLIGERGANLAAFEHMLKKLVKRKYGEEYKFTVDINDYRLRRLEYMKQDIKTAAKEVRMYHRAVPLRPMSSFERRIVHILLAEYPDITTESVGSEPNRQVVIKPFNP